MTGFQRPISAHGTPQPVVVVSGLPRSGTSMMMQMLQAGGLVILTDNVRQADDSNPLGYFELEAVKTLDRTVNPDWLASARGKAVKIVSPLLRHLPATFDYQVVFMRRNLDEVLTSQDRMLERAGGSPSADEAERLRGHYEGHLSQVLEMLRSRACFDIVEVDYEHAARSPREVARQVADFLGGDLDVERMAQVVDATLYRSRR